MSWTGRQLNQLADSYGITHSYTYNSDGIRTKKVSTGFTTNYFLNGSTILAEQQYDKTIWYIYGSSGEILGFVCNGTPYYYLKNQQGDVIKVVNASMNVVASYTYDAWGKVLSAAGSMANVNPIRYRGYYYDTETGFYYLQSRYYDPETGRFLNADGTIGANEEIVAYNLFAYCDNNPTNYLDDTGERKVVPVPRSYNYNYNRKLYFSGLIYDQCTGNAAKARFGAKTGDYNGCGWVATYTALLLSGRYIHPCNIISYYEQNGMVASGLIGVMPWAVYRYLNNLGYSPQLLSNSRYFDQAMKTRNVAILLYIHAKGMHYIAVSKFGKYFWGYNVYIGDRKVQSLGTSLSGWLRSKKYTAIALITLRSNLVYRRV